MQQALVLRYEDTKCDDVWVAVVFCKHSTSFYPVPSDSSSKSLVNNVLSGQGQGKTKAAAREEAACRAMLISAAGL